MTLQAGQRSYGAGRDAAGIGPVRADALLPALFGAEPTQCTPIVLKPAIGPSSTDGGSPFQKPARARKALGRGTSGDRDV
jgi:hypothetical protein